MALAGKLESHQEAFNKTMLASAQDLYQTGSYLIPRWIGGNIDEHVSQWEGQGITWKAGRKHFI